MEPAQYFSLLVLLVCVIHIIAGIGARIQSRRPLSARGAAPATKGSLAAAAPQRSDWYVFFHCSDLVGKEKEPAKKNAVSVSPDRSHPQHTRQPASRRRQSRLILP